MLAVSVLVLAIVSVPVLAVTVSPLREVAVATPRVGVTSVGEVAKTTLPVPVETLPRSVRVPLASGTVMVRSAVGSVTERVVSKAFCVAPSKRSGVPPSSSPAMVSVSVAASPKVTVLPVAEKVPSVDKFVPKDVAANTRVGTRTRGEANDSARRRRRKDVYIFDDYLDVSRLE